MSAKRANKVAARESQSKKSRSPEQQVEDLPADEAKLRGVKGGGHDICTCKVCFPED